jgi:hypothetical protein
MEMVQYLGTENALENRRVDGLGAGTECAEHQRCGGWEGTHRTGREMRHSRQWRDGRGTRDGITNEGCDICLVVFYLRTSPRYSKKPMTNENYIQEGTHGPH